MAQSHSILIVEDDAAIQESLKDALELEGYQVKTANHGAEALDLIGSDVLQDKQLPCLVLLDLMMPVMDGWDFIEAISQEEKTADMPILVISAVASKKNISAPNVKELIKKPIDFAHLLSVVRQHC